MKLVRSVPNEVYVERVSQAFRDSVLPEHYPVLITTNFATPRYGGNDCLVLDMLVVRPPKAPDTQYAISLTESLRLYVNSVGGDYCERLANSITNVKEENAYDRYLHGYVVTTGLLLSSLTFVQATALTYVLNLVLIFLVLCMAWRDRHKGRGKSYLVLGVGVLLFTGIHSYGWQPSFSFGDMVLLAFIATMATRGNALLASEQPHGELSGLPICVFAIFGSLTASFEFLTGHLPVAIALILFAFAIETHQKPRAVFIALFTFCLSFLSTFLLKFFLLSVINEPGLGGEVTGRISKWISHDQWDISEANEEYLRSFGITVELIKDHRILAYGYNIAKMVYNAPYIMVTKLVGALVMLGLPLLLLVLLSVGYWKNRIAVWKSALSLSALAVIFGWNFVFISHGIVHNSFMNRTLAWAGVISAAIIFSVLRDICSKASIQDTDPPRRPH